MALPRLGATAALVFFFIFSNLCYLANASSLRTKVNLTMGTGIIREAYTTNAICSKKNCINPIFPALEDLHTLQGHAGWLCSDLAKVSEHLGFCRGVISYDPALPVPQSGGAFSVKTAVQAQDNAAATAYYYHLSGMGLEPWDYQEPEFQSDCVKSIWRMVCFTYFPRREMGCQDGAMTSYLRPCRSSCMNYIRHCEVECCDESVQCVFTHEKAVAGAIGEVVTTQGYIAHDGPSSLCTGGASRSAKPLGAVFWIIIALAMAWSLQGCTTDRTAAYLDVPEHHVGNWRGEPDYLLENEFVPPGEPITAATLNSCSQSGVSESVVCSGRGHCTQWSVDGPNSDLYFCSCTRYWAGPECKVRRKSQAMAYFFALFFGLLGFDQFYLCNSLWGFFKLFSLGGFGIRYVYDIVQIGSTQVHACRYKVAADLPPFIFVLTTTLAAVTLGFCISACVVIGFRFQRRKMSYMIQLEQERQLYKEKFPIKGQCEYKPYGTIPGFMGPITNPPAFMPPMSQQAGRWIGQAEPMDKVVLSTEEISDDIEQRMTERAEEVTADWAKF